MPADIAKLQKAANEFALDYLNTHNLGVPSGLAEVEFEAVMKIVHRSLVEAWAAGYMAAKKRKS